MASSPAGAQGLTLDECYRRAVRQNETVEMQQQALEQAKARVDQAFATYLPNLSASGVLLEQAPTPNPVAQQVSPQSQQTARLTLSQSVFRGTKDTNTYRKTKLNRDAQASGLEDSKRRLYIQVAENFFAVLSLQSDLDLLQEEIELNRKRLVETQAFVSSGKSKRSELLTIQSNIANLESQIAALSGQLRSQREALVILTGVGKDAPLRVDVSAPNLRLEDLLKNGKTRPDLASAKLEADASRAAVSAAWGGHLPNLDLQGNYYVNRPGALKDITWDAQVLLTIPLYSGGLVQSQVRESVAEHKTKDLRHSLKLKEVEQDIRMLFEIWKGQKEQVEKLRRVHQLSKETFSSVRSEFRSGTASTSDLLVAQATLQQAKRSLARTEYDSLLTFVKLKLAANQMPLKE